MKLEFKNFIIERVDARNIAIYQLKNVIKNKTKMPTQGWQIVGHYGKLEIALKSLLDLKISNSDISDVKGLLVAIKDAKNEIIEEVSGNAE